jgi:hypothetical protein
MSRNVEFDSLHKAYVAQHSISSVKALSRFLLQANYDFLYSPDQFKGEKVERAQDECITCSAAILKLIVAGSFKRYFRCSNMDRIYTQRRNKVRRALASSVTKFLLK